VHESGPSSQGDRRPARAVATLMALVLGGLGASTLASAHSSARDIPGFALDGSAAMWMGGLYLALAGMPLALWFRTPRAAALWTVACGVALVGCLEMAIRAAHG
jgi:hypothetical protein